MLQARQKVRVALLAFALGLLLCAPALAGQTMNIQWPQNSISMSQLQNVMAANPGFSQYNIQFPNNLTWNVSPIQMQSMYDNYLDEARALGYKAGLPNLNFSSLGSAIRDPSSLNIPIDASRMQQNIEDALRAARYGDMHLPDWMPGWFKDGLVTLWGWISNFWDWFGAKCASLAQSVSR